jgi:hypothetical protein
VDGAPAVAAIHAADPAGRKMGPIEQRFGLGDKRRIFVVAPLGTALLIDGAVIADTAGDGLPSAERAGAIRVSSLRLGLAGAKRHGCLGDRHVQFLQEVRDEFVSWALQVIQRLRCSPPRQATLACHLPNFDGKRERTGLRAARKMEQSTERSRT